MHSVCFFILFVLGLNFLFSSSVDALGLSSSPILEVFDSMPETEKEIIERYGDLNGNPVPVIFKGAAKGWGISNWSPEFFVQHYGDITIYAMAKDNLNVAPEPNLRFGQCRVQKKLSHAITVKDFIDAMTCRPHEASFYFYAHVPNAWNVPDLETVLNGTHYPEFNHKPAEHYMIFIGPEGTVASLHNHDSTFLAQLFGKKLITMLEPGYAEALECVPEKYRPHHVNYCLDILGIDTYEYPQLKNVSMYQGVIEAGDILYIPNLWLHDIRALSPSMSLARWGR